MAQNRNSSRGTPTGSKIPQIDTTTYGGGLQDTKSSKRGRRAAGLSGTASRRGRRRAVREKRTPAETNAGALITRRNLLLGALGVGAVAAGAVGVQALSSREDDPEEVPTIEVAEEDVFDLESCAEIDPNDAFELIGDFELPFGTLVWADDDEIAACLLPTEQATPLVTMAALSLSSGNYFVLLEQAVGAAEGFEVYDVRGNGNGFVWTEASIMEGLWRIYVAPLSDFMLGEARLVDEGDAALETPALGVMGEFAFWQTCAPATNENARHEPATVKRAAFASGTATTVHESVGRMSAPLACSDGNVVFTPRHENATSYCDLVCMDASSGKVKERTTLPSGMLPNQVGFGATGFAFCFESIYDYGGGIANLGTYTPASAPSAGSYDALTWFRFNRTPTAAPCWCGDTWFMVKSNQSVCAVNLENRVFCSLGVESGCLDWGDYLVSSGVREVITTAMQIDQIDNENVETKKTQVRTWRALAAGSEPAEPVDQPAAGGE